MFFHCPLLSEHSDRLMMDLFHNGFSPPFDIYEIVFSSNLQAYKSLLRFVKNAGLNL